MSFINLFSSKSFQKKIIATFLFIIIYRLGSFIPITGLDFNQFNQLFENSGILSFIDLFSGGSLARFSVFSLGILPYINASIIIQMLTFVTPSLKDLAKEGISGQKQIAQYTRYLTVALACIQATVMSVGFKSFVLPDMPLSLFLPYSIVSLVAGAVFVMWIAELMSENGIGNGASLLIFIGIVAEFPVYIQRTLVLVSGGGNLTGVVIMLMSLVLLISGIVYVQEAERRLKVQYAKRVVGRKLMGAQTAYIPLRLIQGGVLPIIFASALLQFPLLISQYIPFDAVKSFFDQYYSYNGFVYNLFFALLIFFFSYFYTAVSFNPEELSKNIKSNGGFILGVRPGKPTEEYLEQTVSSLTLIGASFLALIAVLPVIVSNITKVDSFQGLGGTALLILVGVALDLMKQLKTFTISEQYNSYSK